MFEPWVITVKPTEEECRYEVAIQSVGQVRRSGRGK